MTGNSNLLDKEEDVFVPQEPSYLRFVEWILSTLTLIGVTFSLFLSAGASTRKK